MKTFCDEEELKTMEEWEHQHIKECPIKYEGAIGGRCTYQFTPTSIGTVCKITCECGAMLDATRYDWW